MLNKIIKLSLSDGLFCLMILEYIFKLKQTNQVNQMLEWIWILFKRQNRESVEGYSKIIVMKSNDKFGKKDWSRQVEHMQRDGTRCPEE